MMRIKSLINIFRNKEGNSEIEGPCNNRPELDMKRYIFACVVVDKIGANKEKK